jgi:antitoxin CcdA
MGYDRTAPKRPVNLNLNSDLVEHFRGEVPNLSAHVEELLAADLARRELQAEEERMKTRQAVEFFSALHSEYGTLSEEMGQWQ